MGLRAPDDLLLVAGSHYLNWASHSAGTSRRQHRSARKGVGVNVRTSNRQANKTGSNPETDRIAMGLDGSHPVGSQMGLSGNKLEINQKELGRACGQESLVPK